MQPRMGEFTEEWVRQKAHRLYVEAEAQMDIEPGHTALLVIDMTDEFVKPHWSPYWVPAATRAVPRIRPSSTRSARPAGRSSTSPTSWASAG